MIDVSELQYLTAEDYSFRMSEIFAGIRELMNDAELLTKSFVNDKRMTVEDVAAYLHCQVHNIPRDIPCVKVGRTYIYTLSDVEKFIAQKKKPRRNEG